MAKRTVKTKKPVQGAIGSPFLRHIGLKEERVSHGEHPFTIPIIENGLELTFETPVTFIVGENGSGKSSLLEAIAWALGYSAHGGNVTRSYEEESDGYRLDRALDLSWRQRVWDGPFMTLGRPCVGG
jgi:predicted ATPase